MLQEAQTAFVRLRLSKRRTDFYEYMWEEAEPFHEAKLKPGV
jgi:hypothetical protein